MTDGIPIPELTGEPPAEPMMLPTLAEVGHGPEEPPQEEPRRKRGRPRASDAAPAEPSDEEKQMLASAFTLAFDYGFKMLAAKRGDHWLLRNEESATMGNAWSAAMTPYMGTFAKYTPILAAIVVTAGAVGPRVQHDAAIAEEEAKRTHPADASKGKEKAK